MLSRFQNTDDPLTAHFVVWTCSLAPEAIPDYGPAIVLARRAALEEAGVSAEGLEGDILHRYFRRNCTSAEAAIEGSPYSVRVFSCVDADRRALP